MSELISGKEAKLAWANGEDVQITGKSREEWFPINEARVPLSVFDDEDFRFRIKPKTIKVELEVPFILNAEATQDAVVINFKNSSDHFAFIKQLVEVNRNFK